MKLYLGMKLKRQKRYMYSVDRSICYQTRPHWAIITVRSIKCNLLNQLMNPFPDWDWLPCQKWHLLSCHLFAWLKSHQALKTHTVHPCKVQTTWIWWYSTVQTQFYACIETQANDINCIPDPSHLLNPTLTEKDKINEAFSSRELQYDLYYFITRADNLTNVWLKTKALPNFSSKSTSPYSCITLIP